MYCLPLLTFNFDWSNKSHLCDRLNWSLSLHWFPIDDDNDNDDNDGDNDDDDSENDDDEESIGLDKGTQLSEGYNYPCKGSHAILPGAKHDHDEDWDDRDREDRDKEEKEKI